MFFRLRTIVIILMAIVIINAIRIIVLERSFNSQLSKEVNITKNVYFRIDNSFSQDEIIKIDAAMELWENISNNYISFKYDIANVSNNEMFSWREDGVPTIYNARSMLRWPKHVVNFVGWTHPGFIALTITETKDIFIEDVDKKFFGVVAAHEIGHVLGCEHSGEITNIMYPNISSKMYRIGTKEIAKVLELR
jgi:hypothetical protein